jgi:hypothetical protein
MAAGSATLTGERRVDLLDSVWSLVFQTGGEDSPAGSLDASVESRLLSDVLARVSDGAPGTAGHGRGSQILNAEEVTTPCEICGGFLNGVFAATGILDSHLGNVGFRSVAPAAALLLPSKVALEAAELCGVLSGKGVGGAIGTGERDHDSTVDAEDGTVAGTGDRLGDAGKGDVPLTCLEGDSEGLHLGWYGAGHAEPYPSSLRDLHLCPVAV